MEETGATNTCSFMTWLVSKPILWLGKWYELHSDETSLSILTLILRTWCLSSYDPQGIETQEKNQDLLSLRNKLSLVLHTSFYWEANSPPRQTTTSIRPLPQVKLSDLTRVKFQTNIWTRFIKNSPWALLRIFVKSKRLVPAHASALFPVRPSHSFGSVA